MGVRFDPATHTYRDGDRVVPGVTRVLDGALSSYAGVPPAALAAAAQRGTYVHSACELLLWQNLHWDSLEPAYKPYIDAFARFLEQSDVEIELPEERVYHPELRYAGTADLVCRISKRRKVRRAIVDYKTALRLMLAVGPQLAAYQEAYNCGKPKSEHALDRYALHLKPDGRYELVPYESAIDFNVFKSCLSIYRFVNKE